jgi:hypothetical protein
VGRSRFALLTRHFLRRFLDNDLISPSGDAHIGLSHVVAAFVVSSLLIVTRLMLKYSQFRLTWSAVADLTFDDAVVFASLATILFGMAATITWDAFYLDSRDEVVLGSLPVSSRLLAASKLAALGVFLAVFTVALNAVPILFSAALTLRPVRHATFEQLVGLTVGHAWASIGAGIWAALAVVALRGLLGWFLPDRILRRIGPLVQGALVLALLGWTVLLPQFLVSARSVWQQGGWKRDAVPPFWFVGLHRSAIGQAGPDGDAMARIALIALAATTVVVILVYLAWPARRQFAGAAGGYSRGMGRSIAARAIGAAGGLLLRSRSLERACFEFTLLGLGRSSAHRLYLAAAVGGGIAWSMGGVFWTFTRQGAAAVTRPSMATLQMQFVLALLLVTAIRFAVTVPVALTANWLFRITERQPPSRYHAGTRWAAFAVGVLPVVALFPADGAMWGWTVAAYHLLVGACYAVLVVELLFNVQMKVPFAAPYISGSIRLKTRWLLYLFGASVLTTQPALAEYLILRSGRLAWALPLALASLASILVFVRRRRERQQSGLVFDEPPLDAIQTLSIFDYAGGD